MSELKPCPFCGGDAEVAHGLNSIFWPLCKRVKECGVEGPIFDTEREAANWWNRRALPTREMGELAKKWQQLAIELREQRGGATRHDYATGQNLGSYYENAAAALEQAAQSLREREGWVMVPPEVIAAAKDWMTTRHVLRDPQAAECICGKCAMAKYILSLAAAPGEDGHE